VRTAADLWPDSASITAHYLRAWAILLSLRLRRPREAALLVAGWQPRGSLRFAWHMPRHLSERARRRLQDRRHGERAGTSGTPR
jgi:hypothetical protein